MALIKPEQLRSGSYSISGSFSGSFIGDGSGLTNLTNIPSPQIVFSNIIASVNVSPNIFLITSSSEEVFKIEQTGVAVLKVQSQEITDPAPNGGIYFTSSSFFVGLSD